MKFFILLLLGIFLVSGLGFSANTTLNYAECQTDSISNNTYCALPSQVLNETLAYKTCISDLNSTIVQGQNNLILTSVNISNSLVALSTSISQVQGLNVTKDYVSCLIDLNQSSHDVIRWKSELDQRDSELKVAKVGLVNISEVQTRDTTISLLNQQKKDADDALRNYVIIAFAVGAGLVYYWKSRMPSSERDTREGRIPKEGRT